jgi:3-deoxy-7-phosphoheptulonate synthase
VLDYELAMLRETAAAPYLASTHLPWIGERTRRLDGAHIELLSRVRNPVMCKVGAGTSEAEIQALATRLNPAAIPGRLTLVPRMGAIDVVRRLPPLVAAVQRTDIPVVWVCDPMHGNTLRLRNGRKARRVSDVRAEVAGFVTALAASGVRPGGLHLEVAPEDAGECIDDEQSSPPRRLFGREPALCDPRLSPQQAHTVIDEFIAQMRHTWTPAIRAFTAPESCPARERILNGVFAPRGVAL